MMNEGVGCLGRPKFSLKATTKTPKGHHPAWKLTVKQPEVSPKVTMRGVQTQMSTLTEVKNVLLRLNNTQRLQLFLDIHLLSGLCNKCFSDPSSTTQQYSSNNPLCNFSCYTILLNSLYSTLNLFINHMKYNIYCELADSFIKQSRK